MGTQQIGNRNMNKLSVFAIVFGLAFALPLFVTAQDPDAEVAAEEDGAEPTAEELLADAEILAEEPNADGEKPLELEDMQLWSSMDLDKDGRLTVGEFERFAMSLGANAQRRSTQQQRQRAASNTAQRRRGAVANRSTTKDVEPNCKRTENLQS